MQSRSRATYLIAHLFFSTCESLNFGLWDSTKFGGEALKNPTCFFDKKISHFVVRMNVSEQVVSLPLCSLAIFAT